MRGTRTTRRSYRRTSIPKAQSFLRRCDRDIPILNHPMLIPLQEERTRLCFIAIERAAGRPGDFRVVVIHLAVAQDSDVPADERDIKCRPLAERELRARGRRVVAVDGSHLMIRLRAAL